jgi:predicted Rossmann fold flavoprotein
MHSIHTIIIGGGPAGLFAGIFLRQGSGLLLEKNLKPGKKLLIAGSGRCNITHTGPIREFFKHYGEHENFIKHSLKQYTNDSLLDFIRENGLKTIVDKNGKVFPASEDSRDVLEFLLNHCKENNTKLLTNQQVLSITVSEDGFITQTKEKQYFSKNLIIATGGKSYPGTGATGDGYAFATSLGHSLVPPKPALTPIFVKEFIYSDLAGVSFIEKPIYIYRKNKKVYEHTGDFGFTHKGISGPAILDSSRYMEPGDLLRINFAGVNTMQFTEQFLDQTARAGKTTVQSFLKNFDMPRSLIKGICEQIGIDADSQLASITKAFRLKLAEFTCEHPFPIEHIGGYNMAMVTAGGVSLDEISPKTMESKIVKNLYFAGEVLDIDGDTGGYNLQAAFSTAYTAAMAINKKEQPIPGL